MHRKQAPSGITLILAIMIMSAVVAIGITLTSVLVFQVRINKVTREGHQGYYAAESGVELGLNKLRTLKSGTLAQALNALSTASFPAGADADYVQYFCPNGPCPGTSLLAASTTVSSEASVPPLVKENQSIFVELYNVDASLAAIANPELCVYAESADGDNDEVLEISWVAWDTALLLSRPQKIYVHYSAFSANGSCGTNPGYNVPVTQFFPAFTHGSLAGFRIRITPLALASTTPNATGVGDVKDMQVHTSPAVASQIQLKSVSDAAGQKQALVALFPWSLPLSGLFDFVIYSDEDLGKNIPISIAQDLRRYGPTAAITADPIPLPTAFSDPEPDCGVLAPCSYYIRLISNAGWGTSLQVAAGTTPAVSIGALASPTCIIRDPFTFTSARSITFTNKPAELTSYELITRPAFVSADENFCP